MNVRHNHSAFTSVRWIALILGVSVGVGALWSSLTAAPKVRGNGAVLVQNVFLPVSNIDPSIDEFIQPVLTSPISASSNLVAFQGDFTFDSTVVSFQNPPISKAGMTDGNWNVSGNVVPGTGSIRTLRVSAFVQDGFSPLSGSGILYNLNLKRISGNQGATSPLNWAPDPDNFVFYNTDLEIHVPGKAVSGRMTIAPNWARAVGLPLAGIGVSAANVTLPVMADIDAAGNLVAFQGDFAFDSTVVGFQNPPVSPVGLTSDNWNVSGNVLPSSGPIRILRISAFANDGNTPLAGTGALFNLNVIRVSTTPGASTALTWMESPDDMIFFDTNLDLHRPGSSLPGNILISWATVDAISLPKVSLDPSVTNFTQPVTASLISPAANLIGFQGDFTFDSTIVNFQNTPVSGAGMTGSNWNVSGNVLPGAGPIRTLRVSAFAMDGFSPLSGSGIVYNLNMMLVTKTPGANTALNWAVVPDNFLFFDTDLNIHQPINTPPGNISIGGGGATASISGNVSSLNPGPAPISNVMLNITGSSTSSTQSDGAGNYASSLVMGGSYVVTPSKNALTPGSTGINNEDLVAVQADILMTAFLNKNEMMAADTNGDGVINTVDAMAIQRFFVGNSATANVGQYRFLPATRSYSALLSSQGNQNYDAFIIGDVVAPFARR